MLRLHSNRLPWKLLWRAKCAPISKFILYHHKIRAWMKCNILPCHFIITFQMSLPLTMHSIKIITLSLFYSFLTFTLTSFLFVWILLFACTQLFTKQHDSFSASAFFFFFVDVDYRVTLTRAQNRKKKLYSLNISNLSCFEKSIILKYGLLNAPLKIHLLIQMNTHT